VGELELAEDLLQRLLDANAEYLARFRERAAA
jgi:hypothetical protein